MFTQLRSYHDNFSCWKSHQCFICKRPTDDKMKFKSNSPVQQEPPSQKVSSPYCYCHNCQNPRGPLSLKYVVVILGWNIPQPSWTFLADFWGVTASCRSLLAGDVPEGRLGKRPMGMRRGATIWRITRKHATFWNFELLHVLFSRVNFFSVLLFLVFQQRKSVIVIDSFK